MKKTVSILLALFICLGVMPGAAFATSERALGDVNGDDCVDNIDAALILKHDAGLMDATDAMKALGDVNSDGFFDNMDAASILKYDAGLITQFCAKHEWVLKTDCTRYDYCKNCGLTRGEAEEHSFYCNVCTKCGAENPTLKEVQKWLKKNGSPSTNGDSYIYHGKLPYEDNKYTNYIVSYDPEEPDMLDVYVTHQIVENGVTYIYTFTIYAEPASASNSFHAGVLLSTAYSTDYTAIFIGEITPSTYNSKAPAFDTHVSTGSLYQYKEALGAGLNLTLACFGLFLEPLGFTIADFGYTAF